LRQTRDDGFANNVDLKKKNNNSSMSNKGGVLQFGQLTQERIAFREAGGASLNLKHARLADIDHVKNNFKNPTIRFDEPRF